MAKDILEPIDNEIHKILDENQDVVQLRDEQAKLKSKFCSRCEKDLKDYKECNCKDGLVRQGEYAIWLDIRPQNIGGQTYTCFECDKHFRLLLHDPRKNCYECSKLAKNKKNLEGLVGNN